MRKKLSLLLVISLITVITICACSVSDSVVGFWVIQKITAGDIVMEEDDAQSLGLTSIGTIKLQKSGKCELDLLGEKSEGTWKQAKDGKIEIQYGDDLKLTGSVDDEGIMTLQDPQGAEYKLKK